MTPDMNIKKILMIEIKSFIETRYYPPYYQGPYIDRVLVITCFIHFIAWHKYVIVHADKLQIMVITKLGN